MSPKVVVSPYVGASSGKVAFLEMLNLTGSLAGWEGDLLIASWVESPLLKQLFIVSINLALGRGLVNL